VRVKFLEVCTREEAEEETQEEDQPKELSVLAKPL